MSQPKDDPADRTHALRECLWRKLQTLDMIAREIGVDMTVQLSCPPAIVVVATFTLTDETSEQVQS